MSDMVFLINDTSTGGATPVVQVRITANTNGTVTFTLTQLAGYVGDLRGLFFDVADELLIGTLSAYGVGLTELQQGNDSISDLGNGANLQGLLGDDGGYDVGVEIGSSGIKINDDFRAFEFTLDSTLRDLTLADFSGVHFGARVTSVGLDSNLDGSFETSRSLSSKTGETTFVVIAPTKDVATVAEDAAASGNVLANDGAASGDVLTVTGWSGGQLGVEYAFADLAFARIRLNADGSYTIDASAADSLAAGESVSHTFTYDVLQTNVDGASTHTVSFRVTITGANDAPLIFAETFTGSVTELGSNADSGSLSTSGSIAFDDADLTDGHTVAFAPVGTTLGTLTALGISDAATGAGAGVVAWTYQVDAAAVAYLAAGETRVEEFAVTIHDDDGTPLSDSATIRVTITGTNDAPVIEGDLFAGTVMELGSNADSGSLSTSGSIAFDDADLTDGHTVAFAPVGTTLGTLTALGISDAATGAGAGVVAWTYQVDATAVAYLAAGETRVEEFGVTLRDDDGTPLADTAIVRVTVTGTNDAPLVSATDVSGEVVELLLPTGTLADSGTIAFSDLDLGDAHAIDPAISVSAGARGSLTASVTTQASNVDGTGGVITWHYSVAAAALEDLDEGESSLDTFTITLNDGQGGTVARTISVTLVGTADGTPPVAHDDALAAVEDTPITYSAAQLLGNDTDADNDTLSIASVTSGAGGTVTLNPNGTVTFVPTANFNGAASFSYRAGDGTHLSNTASVTVAVAAVNDVPVANADTLAAVEDTPITYTAASLLGNDTDADGNPLSIASVSAGTGGTAVLNGNGTVTFTPNANFNGAASFSYRATDGSQSSNLASVIVNVAPVNDAPAVALGIAGQSALVAQVFSFALPAGLFVDAENDPFAYTAKLASGDPLPTWLTFSAASNSFSGTPGFADAGLYIVQVTATDAFGAANSTTFSLTVLDGTAINGTPGNDTLNGTIQGDLINGLGGDDTINAGPGADVINGEGGRDTINGEAGDDTINGGDQDDNLGNGLNGGDGNDIINGNFGNDRLTGGNGNDLLDGGAGADILTGDAGNDTLVGGDDNDTLSAGSGNDTVQGGAGGDSLDGSNGSDTLFGGSGNDSLSDFADGGTNLLAGEDGSDTFSFSNFSSGTNTLDGGADADTFSIFGRGFGTTTVTTGAGADLINLSDANSGTSVLVVADFAPGAGGDVFNLNYTANNTGILQLLTGWDGSANPFGAGFLRLIQVGAHTELQWDQNGPATGGSVYTTLVRFQNTTATSFSSANFTPAYSPDGSAPAGQTITGTAAAETLTGTIGDDIINAAGGDDTINAGPGADVINGEGGRDQINGEAGDDTINGGDQDDNLGNGLSGGDGNDIINGNLGNDRLTGGNGNDLLDGGAGLDTLLGDAGNDTLLGGDNNDSLSGGAGSDTLYGGLGADTLSEQSDGLGTINLMFGEDGNDVLSYTNFSSATTTTIDGGADADTINVNGRASALTITTGSGSDTISLSNATSGSTVVIVTDFTPGAGGDLFSLANTLILLTGWDGSANPFGAAGFLRLVQVGLDAELQWDLNGSASGGSVYTTLVRFQNTSAAAFTSANFTPPYSPDGTAPVGQTITGTVNSETLTGTIGDDTINAGGGNDVVNAGPGADVINGEGGQDSINGEAGDDTINGGDNDDNFGNGLNGGDGNDIINGNLGNDRLFGGNGNDFLDGGIGLDSVFGDNGDDTLLGGDDADTLQGGAGNDTLNGGAGNDNLDGSNGADNLSGGTGNDTLSDTADGSTNVLVGEDGLDMFTFSNFSTGSTTLDGGADADTFNVRGRSGTLTIATGTGSDTLNLSDMSSGSLVLLVTDFTPGAGGDVVNLNYTNFSAGVLQQLTGWDGSSNPFGAGYLRLVQNGADTDLQWDQNGPSTGGSIYTTLVRFIGTTASSFTTANFSPPYNPDGSGVFGQVINGTSGADTLTGSIGDDTITGGDGNDTLNGGNGNDVLDGGGGTDILNGGQGRDRLIGGSHSDTLTGSGSDDLFVFGAFDGNADTITDFVRGVGGDVLDLNATLETFSGIAADHSDAFSGGFLRFQASGSHTLVQVDDDGGGDNWTTLVTLTNSVLTQADAGNYLL